MRSPNLYARLTVAGFMFAGMSCFLIGSCVEDPGGPIQKVSLDPDTIQTVEVWTMHSDHAVITERTIINRCVSDLNRLSYSPPRRMGAWPSDYVVLKDKAGATRAKYLFSEEPYIRVELPGSRFFCIDHEDMPTIGKCLSYAYAVSYIKDLTALAEKEKWDKDDRWSINHYCGQLRLCWPEAALSDPAEPVDLREQLNHLPEISLSRLDEFLDCFNNLRPRLASN
jgi:hypothetical protein